MNGVTEKYSLSEISFWFFSYLELFSLRLLSNKLDLLKSNSILINTSRGGVVDEEYLIELLRENKIYGVGLDVFSKEPPENVEEFKNLNIVTTPHIGASTHEAQFKAGMDTVENIKKILSGDDSAVL